MSKTQYERQKESDARVGVKMRGYRLPIETIEAITRLAADRGESQAATIKAAIDLLAQKSEK